MEPLLLRVEEAARLIGMGKSKTWDLVNRGDIPSIKIGKSRRIPVAALERWIAEQSGECGSDSDQRAGGRDVGLCAGT